MLNRRSAPIMGLEAHRFLSVWEECYGTCMRQNSLEQLQQLTVLDCVQSILSGCMATLLINVAAREAGAVLGWVCMQSVCEGVPGRHSK